MTDNQQNKINSTKARIYLYQMEELRHYTVLIDFFQGKSENNKLDTNFLKTTAKFGANFSKKHRIFAP